MSDLTRAVDELRDAMGWPRFVAWAESHPLLCLAARPFLALTLLAVVVIDAVQRS